MVNNDHNSFGISELILSGGTIQDSVDDHCASLTAIQLLRFSIQLVSHSEMYPGRCH